MERLRHNHPDDTSDLLSALVDDQVDLLERRRAQELIDGCAACALEVRELRMFKQLLSDLPTVQPRRSFTLDPATAARPRRLLFPILRWATLATAVLLFVVLGADILPSASAPQQAATTGGAAAASTGSNIEAFRVPADESGQLDNSTAASAAPDSAAATLPESAASGEPAPAGAAAASSAAEASAAASAGDAAATTADQPTQPSAFDAASPQDDAASTAQQPIPTLAAREQPAAGGSTAGSEPQLRANPPAGADTTDLGNQAAAQQPAQPWSTLRIAQLVLLAALALFGTAAFWTWRKQI